MTEIKDEEIVFRHKNNYYERPKIIFVRIILGLSLFIMNLQLMFFGTKKPTSILYDNFL